MLLIIWSRRSARHRWWLSVLLYQAPHWWLAWIIPTNGPIRPGFDLSASSDINTGKKVARPELWVYFIRNEYCIHLVPQPKFHSALHLVTQASLGLAHQEHNGSAGGILDLSYSCATMSTWFLRRDRLLAPNAISSTDHTCVLEGSCVRVCILVRDQSTKTSRNILAESNDHQWNPIWGPVFWVQFPLLKTVGTHIQACSPGVFGWAGPSNWQHV